MKGRGVRVINPNELRAVTPRRHRQDALRHRGLRRRHRRQTLADTQAARRRSRPSPSRLCSSTSLRAASNADFLSSLASRLARLDKQCGPDGQARSFVDTSGGVSLAASRSALVDALDPDRAGRGRARPCFACAPTDTPTTEQIAKADCAAEKAAIQPLMPPPPLRTLINRPPAEVRADRSTR